MWRIPVSPFLAILATIIASQSLAGDYPLFRFDDTLDLVLEVPMRTLLRTAKKNPVVDGQLHFTDQSGSTVTLDITTTTRGKSRLDLCYLPPLSITLNKAQTESTLFAGQKKLKIVTNCKNSSSFERYLHQEYGIYRAYNVLTDRSFRVRMLNVTYRDIDKKRGDETMPAFFIESESEVAERLGMTIIETKSIKPAQLNPEQTNIYELFQYMIANTDWSILDGPGGDDCCHNGKVIGLPGTENDWVVLPYDFDQAGLIDTQYAMPADGLGIRSVKRRLYRGRCRHNVQLDHTVELFNRRRDDLEAALVPQALADRYKRTAQEYLDEFFVTINDPDKMKQAVIGKCRGAR